jgi:hypothetical protein
MSQYGNQSGRLESKESSHAQRIVHEPPVGEYNCTKSVQTLFMKYEGLKDMLNSMET